MKLSKLQVTNKKIIKCRSPSKIVGSRCNIGLLPRPSFFNLLRPLKAFEGISLILLINNSISFKFSQFEKEFSVIKATPQPIRRINSRFLNCLHKIVGITVIFTSLEAFSTFLTSPSPSVPL